MSRASPHQREAIEHEAALWVVRSGGSSAERAPPELRDWLAESPEHELAYLRGLRAWSRTAEALSPQTAEITPLAPATRRPAAPVWAHGLRQAAAWASVAVVGAAAGGVLWVANSGTAYATGVGEHRVIRLDDGSRVEMNTATKIKVRYTLTGRNIELQQGEALFEVAPNKNRPFNVIANNERVQAVGTAFNVRVRDDGVDVLVTKGVVQVDPEEAANGHQQRLTAGAMATFRARGDRVQPLNAAEIDRALAWRYGAISLNGQTLIQAADEFNRYNLRQLKVADPRIADLQLGGYFRADDLDNFVQALKTTFGVEVSQGGDRTLYLSRAR